MRILNRSGEVRWCPDGRDHTGTARDTRGAVEKACWLIRCGVYEPGRRRGRQRRGKQHAPGARRLDVGLVDQLASVQVDQCGLQPTPGAEFDPSALGRHEAGGHERTRQQHDRQQNGQPAIPSGAPSHRRIIVRIRRLCDSRQHGEPLPPPHRSPGSDPSRRPLMLPAASIRTASSAYSMRPTTYLRPSMSASGTARAAEYAELGAGAVLQLHWAQR